MALPAPSVALRLKYPLKWLTDLVEYPPKWLMDLVEYPPKLLTDLVKYPWTGRDAHGSRCFVKRFQSKIVAAKASTHAA